jgi:hypothetical protein
MVEIILSSVLFSLIAELVDKLIVSTPYGIYQLPYGIYQLHTQPCRRVDSRAVDTYSAAQIRCLQDMKVTCNCNYIHFSRCLGRWQQLACLQQLTAVTVLFQFTCKPLPGMGQGLLPAPPNKAATMPATKLADTAHHNTTLPVAPAGSERKTTESLVCNQPNFVHSAFSSFHCTDLQTASTLSC